MSDDLCALFILCVNLYLSKIILQKERRSQRGQQFLQKDLCRIEKVLYRCKMKFLDINFYFKFRLFKAVFRTQRR